MLLVVGNRLERILEQKRSTNIASNMKHVERRNLNANELFFCVLMSGFLDLVSARTIVENDPLLRRK